MNMIHRKIMNEVHKIGRLVISNDKTYFGVRYSTKIAFCTLTVSTFGTKARFMWYCRAPDFVVHLFHTSLEFFKFLNLKLRL